MQREPQIMAFGGGHLFEDPDAALANYLLNTAVEPTPRIGYIGTANGDRERNTLRFYSAFSRLDCRASHLPLFEKTPGIREYVMSQDIIFVGGGNTKSMLAVWREWGLDEVLKEAWQDGIVMSGSSAGAICWFEQGITDSWAPDLRSLDCLGFLQGSCCPHYDLEPDRKPTYERLVARSEISGGVAIGDAAAAHFVGTDLDRCVTGLSDSGVFRVSSSDGGVTETALETTVPVQ
jgi:peptidase E